MARKDESSAVAERPTAEVAVFDFGADAGAGFENQTQEDIVLPFLKILEGLSPEVSKKVGEGGVKDARAGMLFNTVTEELIDGEKGIEIIPALTEHVFVEWKPRKQGGGFVGVHQLDSTVVKDAKAGAKRFGDFSTKYNEATGEPEGNELNETFYVYGIVAETGNPVVLAFTSTRIASYKKWNSKIQMFQVLGAGGAKVKPPLFAHRVKVTTKSETNNEGTWSTWVLQPAEGDLLRSLIAPNDPRYIAAKQVRDMIAAGFARINHEAAKGSGGARAAGDPEATPTGKVPF